MRAESSDKCKSLVAFVDDDKSLCTSFSRLLRMSGYESISYPSAEAFIDDEDRADFDCLILDIQLGGISGLELRDRLVEAGDRTPVIFITAQDDPDLRAQAERNGCFGYFRKSDPGALIFDCLKKVLTQRNPEIF